MAVIGAIQFAGAVSQSALPQIVESYRIAFLGDPDIPDYSIRLIRNGTEIEVFGGIKYGLGAEFESIVRAAPQLQTVHLTSGGGRLGEAQKLRDVVKRYHLATYVPVECSSACTLIFAAGEERWQLPGARIGFHGPDFPGMSATELTDARQSWGSALKDDGFEPGFVARAMNVPPDDMWYPTEDELITARVVTSLADGSTFAVSGLGSSASVEALAEGVFQDPGFLDALSDIDPATFDEVNRVLQTGYSDGWSVAEIMKATRELTIPLIQANIPKSDDDVLVALAVVVADEYSALLEQDPALCFAYATGEDSVNVLDRIPPEIRSREVELNERVLRTAHERPPSDSAETGRALDLVLQRLESSLTASQSSVFFSESEVDRTSYTDYCVASITFFEEIAALPQQQAATALRFVFQASDMEQ